MSGTWKPSWVRGGQPENLAWVGKDVLAWCSGFYIVFHDVPNNKELLHWCFDQSTGEGACCISGHPTLLLFAFSERIPNPRVIVNAFPSMSKVSECSRGSPNGYLATAFTEHDHVVTLSSFPNFSISVWSWRTGEKLTTVDTQIQEFDGQLLRVTYTGQSLIAQLAKSSGRLLIWEISICGKIVVLKNSEVSLPNNALPYGADWCPEQGPPLLAVADQDGHVYLTTLEANGFERIILSQRCSECVDIEPVSVRWFRGGIVLKTTFCQIRFYRRNEKKFWRKEWHIKTPYHPYILMSHPFKNDRLFYLTYEGNLMYLDVPEGRTVPTEVKRLQYGSVYRFMDWVNPWGHHIVVIDNAKELSVLWSQTGKEISRINLGMTGAISQQVCHPDYPLIGVTSKAGEFAFVGLYDPENPRILLHYRLQREDLDLLKFAYSGNYIAVGASRDGSCFFLSLEQSEPIEVVARLEVKRQLADILLYDHHGHLKLFVLCVTSKSAALGHKLLLYDLPISQSHSTDATHTLELINGFQSLHYRPGSSAQLIGTPYLTRQLQIYGISGWKEVSLVDAVSTGHQVRQAKLHTNRQWITTSGADGTVIVRSGKKIRDCVAVLVPHHRRDFGAVKAIMKASGDLLVSLGHDGSLVAMKLCKDDDPSEVETDVSCQVDLQKDEGKKEKSSVDYNLLDSVVIEMLQRPRQEFAPLEERLNKTWLEWKSEKKIIAQAIECDLKKASIQADFAILKEKVVKLLDENEASSEVERLPLSAFELDKMAHEQKLKAARDDRDDIRLELEMSCASMDRMANWLKVNFWQSSKVPGQSLFSIFGNTEVTNYALYAQHPNADELLMWSQISRNVVRNMVEGDMFCPWIPYCKEELQEALGKKSRLSEYNERQRIDDLLAADEEEKEIDPDDVENQRATEGMTTYRFIDQSPHYYSQFELYSFAHMLVENRILVNDIHGLRTHFNKLFNDMYTAKDREMGLVNERNERIRYIDAELRFLFHQTVPKVPVDPEWNQKEKPESITVVRNYEVKAKPYVSPSEQDLLDRQAAEAEYFRLLLLADDFREKALMVMMDGVLEVRWEDVIKQDVPKPQCMLTKQPEQYTVEDIHAVQQYKKDVEFLMLERERYRRMLEADFIKVSGVMKEGIDRFKRRLDDFFQMKMKLEAAVQQLNCRYLRGYTRNMRRMDFIKDDDRIQENITATRRKLVNLTEELHLLQNVVFEIRSQYETLSNREKVIEKKFRSEFSDLGKGTLDLLMRQYKRRPRMVQKALVASDLYEVGKSALSLVKPLYLPSECIEYLKGLLALDVRPVSMPQSIDSTHWEHLIRLRRHKVDIEMRLKALALEIAEAENTVSNFHQKIFQCKSSIESLKERLGKLRQDKALFDQNMEIQFVLQMGQIEVPPSGEPNDMIDAIFIPRSEINKVNEVILSTGADKSRAMNRTINFRRRTLVREWEHMRLKMRIEDLSEDLYKMQKVVVTREIQLYLKRKARGFRDEKSPQQLEREMEAMRRSFEKVLRDYAEKLDDVEGSINVTRRTNRNLDMKISEMNVVRCDMELKRDLDAEERGKKYYEQKMRILVDRSNLMTKLHDNYGELLIMQTEHELLRLRTYPALKFFKTLGDDPEKKNLC